MEINNFKIGIKDKILVVTSKKNVTLDDLKEVRMLLQESTEYDYNYGMYRDIIGYYDGYDFIKNTSIYCGSLNENVSLKKIQDYIKSEEI